MTLKLSEPGTWGPGNPQSLDWSPRPKEHSPFRREPAPYNKECPQTLTPPHWHHRSRACDRHMPRHGPAKTDTHLNLTTSKWQVYSRPDDTLDTKCQGCHCSIPGQCQIPSKVDWLQERVNRAPLKNRGLPWLSKATPLKLIHNYHRAIFTT